MLNSIDSRASEFWRWFSSVAHEFASSLENDRILGELDRRIAALEGVSWEVGRGLERPNALVISPNRNKMLLEISKRMVSLAPVHAEWEFCYAKPPKKWKLRFSVENTDGSRFDVDANEWEYVLLGFPDGTFDVTVCAPNLQEVTEKLRELAAEVSIEGVVGEMGMLRCITEIEVVTTFDEEHQGRSNSLQHLADHLSSLCPE